MQKSSSFFVKKREIEREFDEPLQDIVSGFIIQGETIFSTARILQVSPKTLRQFAVREGIKDVRGQTTNPLPKRTNPNHAQRVRSGVRSRYRARPRHGYRDTIQFGHKALMPIEWAEEAGLQGKEARRYADRLRKRLSRGMPVRAAVTTPPITRARRANKR